MSKRAKALWSQKGDYHAPAHAHAQCCGHAGHALAILMEGFVEQYFWAKTNRQIFPEALLLRPSFQQGVESAAAAQLGMVEAVLRLIWDALDLSLPGL